MDCQRFDRLAKSLSAPDTRRHLLRRLAPLPLTALLATLLYDEGAAGGRRKRSKKRQQHHSGDGKDNRTGKRTGQTKRACANAGQTPQKGNRKGCCQGLTKDGTGRCAAAVAPGPGPGPDPTPAPCSGLKPIATGSSPTQGLQEAIDQAVREGTPTLTLCAGTWTLSAPVVIADTGGGSNDLTLIGTGADATFLDGDNKVGVLQIAQGATVMLQDLTITKGNARGGGGIANDGVLTLLGVSVTGNTASSVGGGIFNVGVLTLQTGSSVTGNGDTVTWGGGIYSSGTTILQTGSRVTRNIASDGGGIFNQLGMTILQTGSSVTDNTAVYGGGGIFIDTGTVELQTGSRVTGNTADFAGGIYINDGGFINDGGMVTVDDNALVCNNTPGDDQCFNPTDVAIANCPNPSDGICR